MKISKFVKIEKDILLEYIYDNSNLISETYKVLLNLKEDSLSYISGDSSITNNKKSDNLFLIDPVLNNWGVVDLENYSFLQTKDFSAGVPVRYDTIKVHIPTNYTFGEFFGFHLKIYTFDYNNRVQHVISNFYYDITNNQTFDYIEFNNPPLLIQEKLWGKSIEILVPSVYSIANQRINNEIIPNSINFNLTNGVGLSLNSPIFIDFSFIQNKRTISNITTYNLSGQRQIVIPQSPEFENLAVTIEESSQGDYFEIYGTFNNSSVEFSRFINDSVFVGKRYNVEYVVTIFEQNIRGKSSTFFVSDNFDEKIEFRPIIKFSTTTAIIDVQMRLIDLVDGTHITRRASFGMLPNQVSKYSLNLSKINITGASNPKIYNIKNPLGADIFSNNIQQTNSIRNIQLEPIKVPFPVLIERFNIVCKSDSVVIGKDTFFSNGAIVIDIYPFDNIIKFIVADKINDNEVEYLDLSSSSDVRLVFKNDQIVASFELFMESGEVNLSQGVLVFKIESNRIRDLKRIFETNNKIFFITTRNEGITTSIYSGLFRIFDTQQNIEELNIRNRAETPRITPMVDSDLIIAVQEDFGNDVIVPNKPRSVLIDTPVSSIVQFVDETTLDLFRTATTINLFWSSSYATSAPISLYYIVTNTLELIGSLVNLTTIQILSSDVDMFTLINNTNSSESISFPIFNNIKNTSFGQSNFTQLVEFAIYVPSIYPLVKPKSIKINGSNQFIDINNWSEVIIEDGTTYKFTLELRPTDIVDFLFDDLV